MIDLFQKGAQVEGAKPSSHSAECEISFRHFFFAKRNQSLIDCNGAKRNFFSFVPLVSKKKAG